MDFFLGFAFTKEERVPCLEFELELLLSVPLGAFGLLESPFPFPFLFDFGGISCVTLMVSNPPAGSWLKGGKRCSKTTTRRTMARAWLPQQGVDEPARQLPEIQAGLQPFIQETRALQKAKMAARRRRKRKPPNQTGGTPKVARIMEEKRQLG